MVGGVGGGFDEFDEDADGEALREADAASGTTTEDVASAYPLQSIEIFG